MSISPAKEQMLKKIRQALAQPVPVPFAQQDSGKTFFSPTEKELEVLFAEHFTGLAGRFSFCESEEEMAEQLNLLTATHKLKSFYCNDAALEEMLQHRGFAGPFSKDLPNVHAGITTCECLVARTGSLLLSSTLPGGRSGSVYAPIHICIAYTDQLVYDIKDALQLMREKYPDGLPSLLSLATGPSRTADIEKTLVVGVHGPGEVYVFLIDKTA